MGAELGATTSIFPSDALTRRFLALQGREQDFRPLAAQGRPGYAAVEEVDLDRAGTPRRLAPVPRTSVVPVRENWRGLLVEQVLIGSCANSSLAGSAGRRRGPCTGRRVHPRVSLEINPGSRQVLENLILAGGLVPSTSAMPSQWTASEERGWAGWAGPWWRKSPRCRRISFRGGAERRGRTKSPTGYGCRPCSINRRTDSEKCAEKTALGEQQI